MFFDKNFYDKIFDDKNSNLSDEEIEKLTLDIANKFLKTRPVEDRYNFLDYLSKTEVNNKYEKFLRDFAIKEMKRYTPKCDILDNFKKLIENKQIKFIGVSETIQYNMPVLIQEIVLLLNDKFYKDAISELENLIIKNGINLIFDDKFCNFVKSLIDKNDFKISKEKLDINEFEKFVKGEKK